MFSMPSVATRAGNGTRTVSPQAKKRTWNAVSRETPRCIPGWRSQREYQIMPSSAAAFGCLQPEQGSAGNGGGAVLPQAKKPSRNAAARETPRCIPGWRSQREYQIMPSSAAAFGCLQPEQGSETQL